MCKNLGLAVGVMLSCSVCVATADTLDTNFLETTFANGGGSITGLGWAPDGSDRLFASRQTGEVEIIKAGVRLAVPFVDVSPVYTANECGLVGFCFDPNFMVNGYVYLFVTVSSSEQQILRYTAVGDVGTDKTVLISGLPTLGQNHNGGGIGVGPDGKLYWAIGDNGNSAGVDGDLTSLGSKVGRANLDGSVPADNPFADGPGGNNDYIWARGFRNPFTLAFQPATGDLWVNCVGTLYEQIFLVQAGDHAGWNDYENTQPAGFLAPKIKYRTRGTDTRNLVAATGAMRTNNLVTFTTTSTHGFRQGERLTIAGVGDASFNGPVYVASVPSTTTFTAEQNGGNATSGGGTATTLNQGGCVAGGAFWDSTSVPPAYRGNFIYGDFVSDRMMRATFGPANEVKTVDYFVTGIGSVIDAAVGPDGALYYAALGGPIFRLAYTNYAAQELVVTPTVARMVEGGMGTVNIRLAQPPAQDVVVNVARTAGHDGVTIAEGAELTFSPANWSVPQTVRLAASTDNNLTNDLALLTVSAAGIPEQTVTVHVIDTQPWFSVGPVSRDPELGLVSVGLAGVPGATYVLEGNSHFVPPWTAISTNTLTDFTTNILDPDSTNWPGRFYRARLVP